MTIRTEIAIAVVEQDDCFLVGRRPTGVPLAGLWEFPGGKVEPGEALEQAVIRECQEEAGIAIEVLAPYAVRDYDYDHAEVRLHFFACHPVARSVQPNGSFRWVRREELGNLEFPSANRALIEQLTADKRPVL